MKNLYAIPVVLLLVLQSFTASAQVPVYSSYAAAEAVILLDFDGQTVNGTSWNSGGPIFCASANLTNTQITEIYNRISEDYRPFNVNVTTDSTKYWAAPAFKRMRVIFTITNQWYGSGAGGVAYTGSFAWGDNTPCFVFTALLSYNTKYIAEAGSHEAGHTLGLRHQASYDANCVKTSDYHNGTGTGEIGWAPIMGTGYYKNMTLWNNGPDPYGCNNIQDDLGIITGGSNGFSYRSDDHANHTGGATDVYFSSNQFTINGVVERTGDTDFFKLSMPVQGNFHLQAVPFNVGAGNVGSDLDIQVEIMSNPVTVVGTYNPSALLNATFDTILNAGTYYIRIQPRGNAYAPQYASLGSYSLQANYTPMIPLALHRLELKGTLSGTSTRLEWNIEADETVAKQSLEVSTNARDFRTLAYPANDDRQFSYVASKNEILYYRLNLTLSNGRQYYSNTIAIRNQGSTPRPYLVSNLVRSSMTISSPGACTYVISDYTGKQITSGKLTEGANNLYTGNLSQGLYFIQFSNGQEQVSEKFVRQ